MEDIQGFIYGIIIMVLLAIFAWHVAESDCQHKYDVADCTIDWNAVPVSQEKPNK